MRKPLLVPLGGFLGAGKTSLILTAARLLAGRGLRVAAVLNDQGGELVDTRLVERNGIAAGEVTGGCFCCRFSNLIEAAQRLESVAPDVVFAEAVGSCTDISATTLQPLKRDYASRFGLAPFTVLVDPERARELLAPGADRDLAFLFRNQIAEADLVCFTKSDLAIPAPELPGAPCRTLSARTGRGVAAWLDEILAGNGASGGKLLAIDYEEYARAEATLAWMNCGARVRLNRALSPAAVAGPLLESLDRSLGDAGIRIVHLKLMAECAGGYIKAAICGHGQEPTVDGALDVLPVLDHELLLNLRAAGEPARVQAIVERELGRLPGDVKIASMQCFRPAPPKPEHRIEAVVTAPEPRRSPFPPADQ